MLDRSHQVCSTVFSDSMLLLMKLSKDESYCSIVEDSLSYMAVDAPTGWIHLATSDSIRRVNVVVHVDEIKGDEVFQLQRFY